MKTFKCYIVLLNGVAINSYKKLSYANKLVGSIREQTWFSDENDLLEIYDKENGCVIYTNENNTQLRFIGYYLTTLAWDKQVQFFYVCT